MKVQCPQCHRCAFRTTPAYDPDVRPTKYMVEMLNPWASWGWDNHQGAMSADLCCPLCEAPLAPGGRLHTVPDDYREIKLPPTLEERNQAEIDAMFDEEAVDIEDEATIEVNPHQCEVCGKVCKSALGLNSHMRSHA